MSVRKPITDKMKIASLRFHGTHRCPECLQFIYHYQPVQYDHRHATVHLGPHEAENIRAIHVECHKVKTARDVKANAKVKRIAKGGRKAKRPMKRPMLIGTARFKDGDVYIFADGTSQKVVAEKRKGPKIASRGFQKKPEGYKTRWSRT